VKSSNTVPPAFVRAAPKRIEQPLRWRVNFGAPPSATSRMRSTVLPQIGQTDPTSALTSPRMHIPQ
jgi:hypothetical protein